ncbi:MAG: hypothetical protein AAGA46_08265 [Cyanobacteria bacterium P01_F01_bin.13]
MTKHSITLEEQLKQRLAELRTEFASGQATLSKIENRQTNYRQAILRISGAIQVIEEELIKGKKPFGAKNLDQPSVSNTISEPYFPYQQVTTQNVDTLHPGINNASILS